MMKYDKVMGDTAKLLQDAFDEEARRRKGPPSKVEVVVPVVQTNDPEKLPSMEDILS